MNRKIIIIGFLLISDLQTNQKIIYLLFVCTLSYFLTLKNKPFMGKRLNILEEEANLSVLLTIFSGSLFILNIDDLTKGITFIAILIINLRFLVIWFIPVVKIYLMVYGKRIFKYFPKLINFVAIWQFTSNTTDFEYNLPRFMFQFARNLINNSRFYNVREF